MFSNLNLQSHGEWQTTAPKVARERARERLCMKVDLKIELSDQAGFEVNISGGPFGYLVMY